MTRFLLAGMLVAVGLSARADEGMWLYNQPPAQSLRAHYQFDPTPAWLDHLQRASVRVGGGGSGSFVSEDGLLISNHHVGAGTLQKLSTPERNLLRDGFQARTLADELPCHDLELNVLQSVADVTARVNAAVPKDADPDRAFAARREVIAQIEKESLDRTGQRSDVVTLWQGGAYHLYRCQRYTDVRLVFAPAESIASFGGDPDNFEFPRYDLDICFFRAYEAGRPARVAEFLRFSPQGAGVGELVFVSGHPGRTSRLLTVAELTNLRDQALPLRLASLYRQEILLSTWGQRSEENARRCRRGLVGIQNSRKASEGRLAGLQDPAFLTAKAQAETEFRSRLAGRPEFADALGAYAAIAEATRILAAQSARRSLFESGQGLSCESFHFARTLLRAGDEQPKPDGQRLREFSAAGRASLELGLFSPKPIYTDLEVLTLADALTFLAGQLGASDPLVVKVLAGKSPRDRAGELIPATRVRDVAVRRALYAGGASAVAGANDPMIELARLVDAEARALRQVAEAQGEVREQAHAAIARARNALNGTAGYPDATGTLRLSYGTVKGYEEAGHPVPALTTFAGLYDRAKAMGGRPPFELPAVWTKGKGRLKLATPFNFVSTCDIIGGNSGSPVVNRAGEFVGIIFDGNLQSLPGDYFFDDRQNRAVSVHSAAILAALTRIYDARGLARELTRGRLTK
jgi:hypothetical protein